MRKLSVLIVVAGLAHSVNAQEPRLATAAPQLIELRVIDRSDIRFSRISRATGTSQTRVTAIVQDTPGFMWFATQYGLNRYDGYTLRRFRHQAHDSSSSSDSYIRNIYLDREGRLWVCTLGVLDRYDAAAETFFHYPLDIPSSANYSLGPRQLLQDAHGMLWVATGVGLYRVNPATGQSVSFHHHADEPASLGSDDVKSVGFDRRGNLWIATAEGLDEFDVSTERVAMHVPLPETREMSFHEDRSGRFWIIYSSGHGLAQLDRDKGILTRYSFNSADTDPQKLTGVSSILEDSDGQLWVGTQTQGLLRLDADHRQATRYRNDPLDVESLAEDRTTTLSQDREGNIWVGLGASAPNYFTPHSGAVRALPFDAGNRANLGEKLVNVLYEDPGGTFWVGTTGALEKYDRVSRTYQRVSIPGIDDSDVLAIVQDRTGAYWVGTSGQGLVRVDPHTHQSKIYRHRDGDPASLSNDLITHLLVDRAGRLWATTLDGLVRYDPATDGFRTFRVGLPGSALYESVVEDSSGTLWVSGADGVIHFDPTQEQFLPFAEGAQARGPGILAARNGEIWGGTSTGLYRFNPASHTTRLYTEADGLASNSIECILEDSAGDVWMSTTQGVSRLLRAADRFRNYSVEDGLPGHDLTGWSACHRSADGRLYFGGFEGAVEIDPRAVVDNAYTPPVALTRFEGPALDRSISYTHELTLPSDQRSFSIEFAALSFRSPATNRYRYRLDGLDTGWHEVGSERRVASYTTLPPGNYTFRVQGATNRSPWTEPGVELQVTVERPWWATWECRLLAGLCVLGIGYSLYSYRIKRIADTLEIRFGERLGERARIARDLHDSLLQGFQGLTLKFHALANTMAPESPPRTRMESILRQARELIEEVRTRVRDLRTHDEPSTGLAEQLRRFVADLTHTASASFAMSIVGEAKPLDPIAFDEIFHVAREAISNAFMHAHASRIELEITYSRRALKLRVGDDGRGMDRDTLQAGREGHFGLVGMRERAQSLGAILEVWSRPGAGTEIDLEVPARVAYSRR